jgi:hypothetical protein
MSCAAVSTISNPCGPCVTFVSAGAYAPPCGYSTNEPAPPALCLPGYNKSCIITPPIPRPWSRWVQHEDEFVHKQIEQNYASARTFVIDNNVHHQHNRTVQTTVNRRHLHTHRVITRENNFHHFNTDFVVKVNDIHSQRVEQVQSEGVTVNDFRQTQRVEPATCQVTAEACGVVASVGGCALAPAGGCALAPNNPCNGAPGQTVNPSPDTCATAQVAPDALVSVSQNGGTYATATAPLY